MRNSTLFIKIQIKYHPIKLVNLKIKIINLYMNLYYDHSYSLFYKRLVKIHNIHYYLSFITNLLKENFIISDLCHKKTKKTAILLKS